MRCSRSFLLGAVALIACEGYGAGPGPFTLANVSGTISFTTGVLGYPGAKISVNLAGAKVVIQGRDTISSASGTFRLTSLLIGSTSLSVTADGYADTTVSVTLRGGENEVSVVMRVVPQVVLGDTAIRFTGPGVARTSLGFRVKQGIFTDDPMPTFTATGPFTAERGGQGYRDRNVKITASGPGTGSLIVAYGSMADTVRLEAVSLKFKTINVGSANACAIALDDTAWCWGGNYGGQLGASTPYLCNGGACQYGGREGNETPLPVVGGMQFVQVATMGYVCASFGPIQTCGTSCALTSDGQPWCWGGTPTRMANVSLKHLAMRSRGPNGSFRSGLGGGLCGLDHEGRARCFTSTSASTDGGGMTFQSYSGAENHSCGVDLSGDVYCWGGNTRGELGIGTTDTATHSPARAAASVKFSEVRTGESSTCALATTGVIHCWGLGFTSAGDSPPPSCPGAPTLLCAPTPRALTGSAEYVTMGRGEGSLACGLKADGSVDCWTSFNSAPVTPPLPPLKTISVGSGSTGYGGAGLAYDACGLTADGIAYCWRGTTVFKIAQP